MRSPASDRRPSASRHEGWDEGLLIALDALRDRALLIEDGAAGTWLLPSLRIAVATTISDYHVSEKQRLLRHRPVQRSRASSPTSASPPQAPHSTHAAPRPPPFEQAPSGTHALISAAGTGAIGPFRPVTVPNVSRDGCVWRMYSC
jgi:hypothetical protein